MPRDSRRYDRPPHRQVTASAPNWLIGAHAAAPGVRDLEAVGEALGAFFLAPSADRWMRVSRSFVRGFSLSVRRIWLSARCAAGGAAETLTAWRQ
jgi:hypothetical protein